MNYNLIKSIIEVPLYDLCLCILFTNKSRWFQLHSLINILILKDIIEDVYNLILDPVNIKKIENPQELYYIVMLHLYHFLFFKNTLMDYFHHSVFVLLGTIPVYYYYNYNLIRLATFAGCGLPGAIEYGLLSFVKHKRLTSFKNKIIMSNIYNYLRYPFSVFASSIIYVNYILGNTPEVSKNVVMYTIFMIYFNGSYFNKLTIENKTWHSLSIRSTTR